MEKRQDIPSDAVIKLLHHTEGEPVGETFMGKDVNQVIIAVVGSNDKDPSSWLTSTMVGHGKQCEMLVPGGQWVKGRLNIRMTFTPEEQPEQP